MLLCSYLTIVDEQSICNMDVLIQIVKNRQLIVYLAGQELL